MLRRLPLLVFAFALPAFAGHVVFVDNTHAPGGDGTAAAPFASIASASAIPGVQAIVVAQTPLPYVESVMLQKGQMLVGSSYGLEALRAELKADFDASAPAQAGPGPTIRGTVAVMGDNVVAGCTLVAERGTSAVSGVASEGTLTLREVSFKTSQRAFAIYLQEQHGPVSIIGGGVEASNEGSGIAVIGGYGDVTIERFPMSGAFGSVVRVADRIVGAVSFRNGSAIHADDAADDAVVVTTTKPKARVTFADRVQIRGRRRGLVVSSVAGFTLNGGDSWLATKGTALDLRDATASITLDSVSSEGAAEGIVLDKVRGKVEVTGVNSQPGSGGVVRGARSYGVRITQSSNVRLANMTIAASGANTTGKLKGAKCAGEFDLNTNAPCNAALYLRHLDASSFENIVVDGGGAMGLNANNIRDVKFDNVEVRGSGDESFEAGVLLQEVNGTVQFNRCRFTDNAGSEVLLEQKFNKGHVTFDRCVFSAEQRPTVASRLVDIHVLAASQLEIEIRDGQMHDNAGAAIDASASGTSSLALTVSDVTMQRLGTGGLSLHATESAHAAVQLIRVQIAAPAAPAAVDLSASGSASLCADLSLSAFTGGAPPVRLAAHDQATARVVSNAAGPAALANAFAAANAGATIAVDVPPASLSIVTSCH